MSYMKTPRNATANFKRLYPFFAATDAQGGHYRFHAGSIMPLVVENLGYTFLDFPVYSITHYYTQNGDAMRDPDMTVAVDAYGEKIIPLTFQQDGAPIVGTLYQEVFSPDEKTYKPALLKDLDSFLATWSRNIIAQGFSADEPTRPVSLDDFASRYSSAE